MFVVSFGRPCQQEEFMSHTQPQSCPFSQRTARMFIMLAGLALTGNAMHAQSAAAPATTQTVAPAYDVAVIKPNKTGAQGMDITFSDHGTFNATNASVRQLIEVAFHMRHDLVFGTPG